MKNTKINIKLNQLIYPLFVKNGNSAKEPILSMEEVYRFSPDILLDEVAQLKSLGITNVILFPVADKKNDYAKYAYSEDNIVYKTIILLKQNFPDIVVFADVCLCAYTTHGHCGILKNTNNNVAIDLEPTLSALAKTALLYAKAGADYVAPSAMAKGQVRAIRETLNENQYQHTKIMGYSAKFASNFYGPFRDAANSSPQFGDRSGYQLNPADPQVALLKIKQDISQGADVIMVKPALSYLDIIQMAKNKFNHTTAAYNVSGEYAMVKAGVRAGYWDEEKIVAEIINSISRAGADIIITYHARNIAKWLNE